MVETRFKGHFLTENVGVKNTTTDLPTQYIMVLSFILMSSRISGEEKDYVLMDGTVRSLYHFIQVGSFHTR